MQIQPSEQALVYLHKKIISILKVAGMKYRKEILPAINTKKERFLVAFPEYSDTESDHCFYLLMWADHELI